MRAIANPSLVDVDPPDDAVPSFRDREDAGTRLAQRLAAHREANTLVLGIPRGGVPVAAAVARALGAELDVLVARKLGAPISPELAIGAVTADGQRFLNESIVRDIGVSAAYLERVTREELAEAARKPAKLVVAVPVGSIDACAALRREADEVVCLATPEPFWAVGVYYEDFGQTEDAEVERLLRDARSARQPAPL